MERTTITDLLKQRILNGIGSNVIIYDNKSFGELTEKLISLMYDSYMTLAKSAYSVVGVPMLDWPIVLFAGEPGFYSPKIPVVVDTELLNLGELNRFYLEQGAIFPAGAKHLCVMCGDNGGILGAY